VKKLILGIVIGLVLGGAAVWLNHRGEGHGPAGEKPTGEAPAEDEPEAPRVTHDAEGRVVVHIDDEAQGNMGLLVAVPEAAQVSPELRGYGRVLDAAPLAALMNELASAQTAATASSNELARLKTLVEQGNASTRALQTADAAAQRDQLAVQSARDRLALSWGQALARRNDLPSIVQSLASLNSLLVRVDLPAAEALPSPPVSARLATLSGLLIEAQFLGPASNVDPQTQSRGFILLIKSGASGFFPGEAVTGYLKLAGQPLAGVIIPRGAVIRTEGAAWIYVLDDSGEAYTRTEIALDHPTDAGWFITKGVTATDHVVVTGAQQLLSVELKGKGGEE
jgi:hypothetical protein